MWLRSLCWAVMLVAPLLAWRGSGRAQEPAAPDVGALKALYRPPSVVPFPEDAPFDPAREALGRRLFFDPALSRSRTMSCATCHDPRLAWGDGMPRAVGDAGEVLPLRAPTLLNMAWLDVLGWDGKFPGLESVTFAPITAAGNMNLDGETLVQRLAEGAGYADAFTLAFGDGTITRERIETALATFERTIVSPPSAFDRWIAGEEGAIGADAQRGFVLFNGAAGCAKCHSGWAFTDGSFHDIGSASGGDVGRGRIFPNSLKLRYAFKTPTLRDVARRAPYMHDGSVPTLAAVIELYDRGGITRPSRSPEIHPLGLSAAEKADLRAFLLTLSGPEVSRSSPDALAPPAGLRFEARE